MPTEILIWLFAGGFGLIGILFALWYHHIQHCRQVGADIAVIKEVTRRIEHEIGDHERGIRGSIHKLRSDITPYIVREQNRRGE